MKPPPFSYHDPATVADAVGLLGRLENAKVLAGGQSLMPMLNMRYVLPDHVVDINGIGDLSHIREDGDVLEIGGLTRQRDLEFSDVVKARCPLLHEAILNVGHRQTRNRGTVGGSLSHLDPSAEIPAVCAAQNAVIRVAGPDGEREIPFAEFPVAYMTPALSENEILTGVRLPLWPAGHGSAFVEFSRRHGDFAIVAAAALVELSGDGSLSRVSVTVSGVGPAPVRMTGMEEALTGAQPTEETFRSAAEACRQIDALEDVHASSSYRQHLAAVLARRALVSAAARAGGGA